MNPLVILAIALPILGLLGYWTWKAPRQASLWVWSLTATILIGAILLRITPGEFGAKALWLALAVPLIWVALQFWVYWDRNRFRATLSLIGITLIGGVIVALSDPML